MSSAPTRASRLPKKAWSGGLSALVLLTAATPAFAEGDSAGAVPAPHTPTTTTVTSAMLVTPRATRALPAAIDARPTYQGASSCDPSDRPGAMALGRLLVDTYGTGRFGISRECSGGVSEHHEGRAIDWMLNASNRADKAVATSALTWLTANNGEMARRLGVMYVIWDRKSWRAYAPERGWTPYTGTSPHTDHIHISLTWDGAMKRTSWWTGSPVTRPDVGPCRVYAGQPAPLHTKARNTPCPVSLPAPPSSAYPVYLLGARHGDIAVAQRALGITADGHFGAGTRSAALAYQARYRLPRTGALDKATWARLVPTGAATRPMAPSAAPAPAPAPAKGNTRPGTTLSVPSTVPQPLGPYKKVLLRPGMARGAAIHNLQLALRVPTTDVVDARTTAAIKAVQKRWRLSPSGVVDLRTWNRVELTRYPWLGYTQTTLRRGSSGPAVSALQGLVRVGADGAFGPKTQQAVMTVQRRYGLGATGVVDPATWRAAGHWSLR